MDPQVAHGHRRRTKGMQSFNSLARDFGWIGSKGSLIKQWCTDGLLGGKLTSVGNDRDGGMIITGGGGLQAYNVEGRLQIPTLGKMGLTPGGLVQPCQTALSADLTVMAVADSGNNCVQLFDTSTNKLLASVGRKGQIRPGRLQRPEGVAFVDGRPEMIVADTGNGRLQVFHVDESTVPPADPADQGTIGGGMNGGGSDDEHECSRRCLLVFEGCREADKLRKSRTAGESDTAEGPLAQPCDVAYWRATSTAGKKEQGEEERHGARTGNSAVAAWTPRLPEWFRPHRSGRRSSGTSESGEEEEERARRELLLPDSQPRSIPISQGQNSAAAIGAGACGGGVVEGGTPRYGSFVVRETELPGKLQLLFVAKTQEAEEAEKQQAEDAGNGPASDLLGSELGEADSTGDLDWMKPAKRDRPSRMSTGSNGHERHREGDRERGGERSDSSSQGAPSTPRPTFEVCDEELTVQDGGKGVEVCGRVYGSLLSLLRAFRGRGFERLVGVTDTRGAPGLVAVAERAGGRARLLHYAPAFPPFYTTELTHLHSIEGLQRPSSVSFNDAGDLLVVDQGSRKVLVYSHLSGRWVLVREFSATSTSGSPQDCEGNRADDCNRPSKPAAGPAAAAAKGRNGETMVHDGEHASGHGVSVQGASSEEHEDGDSKPVAKAATADGASVGAEQYREDSATPPPCQRDRSRLADRKNDWVHDPLDWAPGTGPISARFVTLKARQVPCKPGEPGSEADDPWEASSELSAAIVVGATDGVVRVLRGPKERHCGSFACLAEGTALDIVELLGYRSSQVLGHVNRVMAGLRTTLRREWRLHPLTPGGLARRKVEFLRWGRLVTGEGLPGRGVIADAQGRQLCDRFLATSACARPACPYSHHQPMIDLGSDEGADMCIVFRGGVTHAVNNLYGQIFGWEWEGDLHRLFGERSVVRAIVTRRDPMTLGINGAEVIRQCATEEDCVLDYAGYVDFVTVVHEQATRLRSWHRPFPSPLPADRPATTTSGGDKNGVGVGNGAPSVAAVAAAASAGAEAERRSSSDGEDSAGGGICGRVETDAATPWLGWDFTTPHCDGDYGAAFSRVEDGVDGHRAAIARENVSPGSKCCHATPTAAGDKSVVSHSGRNGCIKVATQSKRVQGDEGDSIDDDLEAGKKDEREEPKTNREYGTTAEEREASVNQVIAFQTDRVVRMLDRMF